MKNLNICIIIINFNCGDYILDCLESIKKNNFLLKNVIIVDNKSSDDSAIKILYKYPEIDFIYSEFNAGFSGGCNIGIQYAILKNYDFFFLLNPDTILCDSFFISFFNQIEDNCLLVPQVLNLRNKLELNNNGGISFFTGRTYSKSIFGTHHNNSEYCYINMTSACALLLPRSFFNTVGFFDENYFLYWEDTDLIYRAKKHGYRIKLILNAKLYHKESSSTGGKKSLTVLYYNYRNRLYFMEKHYINFYQKLFFIFYFLLALIIKLILLLFFCESGKARIIIKAIKDFRKNKFGYQKF